jgi:hypothetical protein
MCHVPDAPPPLAAYANPHPEKKGKALADGATTTVVGVLGEDPLTARILGVLLAGAGHEARAIHAGAVLDSPGAALAGVDVLLLVPWLDEERECEILGAMEGNPATASVPLLRLSTVLGEGPDDRTGWEAWPWSVEDLARAVERAVPAPGGEAT